MLLISCGAVLSTLLPLPCADKQGKGTTAAAPRTSLGKVGFVHLAPRTISAQSPALEPSTPPHHHPPTSCATPLQALPMRLPIRAIRIEKASTSLPASLQSLSRLAARGGVEFGGDESCIPLLSIQVTQRSFASSPTSYTVSSGTSAVPLNWAYQRRLRSGGRVETYLLCSVERLAGWRWQVS
ncbi:hypothetical protein B0T18DRAFT_422421 [Schizothecium vesticola]|uniref:Uncharacterized protein n=1 Tax=Schizothecium vesticola TaxID=314040 RepID=A0AA40BQM3_9PEZI|nr:hypothetical protein B0T18DRAFT_422421 [Schizothecium vesticola]